MAKPHSAVAHVEPLAPDPNEGDATPATKWIGGILLAAALIFLFVGLLFVGLLDELPFRPYLIVALVVPPLALALAVAFPGRFILRDRETPRQIELVQPVVVFVAVPFAATFGIHLISPWTARVAGLAIGGLLTAVAVRASRDLILSRTGIAALFIGASAYSIGALVCIDAEFDTGKPAVYPVEILDRTFSASRSGRSRWISGLTVTPFASYSTPVEVSVELSQHTRPRMRVGDQVCVVVRPGLAGFAWYEVLDCREANSAAKPAPGS